jgi:segregation and condensation protein B
MSLKAKLEAVIYAAEEPVTLAQLAGLFADEALAWKAGEDATALTALAVMPAPFAMESAPLLSETPADSGANSEPNQEAGETAPDAAALAAEPTAESTDPAAEAAEAAAEAEAKRLARLRDREARGVIRQQLDELIAQYAADGRGIEIREIAGGFRMGTKPECHDAVRAFVKSLKPALKLSLPALETLAVIAYKQPVTAPEVNEIRGVDSSGVFGSLLARKLIVTAGRKPVVGRPILYKTTREFLLRFGLKDVSELPSMEEFEKLAASELEEAGLEKAEAPESEPAAEFNPDPNLEAESLETDKSGPESEATQQNDEAPPAAPPETE